MSLFDEEYSPINPTWEKEIWLLDPGPFIDIAFDMGFCNFVFRSQYHESGSVKQDFTKFIDVFSRGRAWKAIWMPWPGNFSVLFTSVKGWAAPAAVWPVWGAKEHKLEEMRRLFDEPPEPGIVLGVFGTKSRSDAYPVAVVEGQPHRVLLRGASKDNDDWGIVATFAQRLQETNPIATLHFHGQKSVGRTIGIAAKSFDHPVRIGWNDGTPMILLPNGMIWYTNRKPTKFQHDWLRVVGVDTKELLKLKVRAEISRETYRINLLSLRWAFLNWHRAWDFRRIEADQEDIETAEMDWEPKSLPVRMRKTKGEIMELDRWLCNTCSLQFRCPYSREGAVCIVPDSEPVELAHYFQTRNSAQIVQALGLILGAQAKRAEHGIRVEIDRADELDDKGNRKLGLSPEVTRILNSIFDRGVQLAKLVDPLLAARLAPRTNILNLNMGDGPTQGLTAPTPQELMAGVEAELIARGINLEDATPEEIEAILVEAGTQSIETTATEDQ